MANLIILPEYQKLKEEISQLRLELPIKIQERDELKFVVCKNIENKYMILVGSLECQAFREEIDCRRQKRRLQLIRARLNRREPILLEWIDEQLELEMAEYE